MPCCSKTFGGRAGGRVSSSSRFIPTKYPSSVGTKVRVHMRLISHRILHGLPRKLYPIPEHREWTHGAISPAAICGPDLVDKLPLAVQRGIGRQERIALIVNVRSFGRRAIE